MPFILPSLDQLRQTRTYQNASPDQLLGLEDRLNTDMQRQAIPAQPPAPGQDGLVNTLSQPPGQQHNLLPQAPQPARQLLVDTSFGLPSERVYQLAAEQQRQQQARPAALLPRNPAEFAAQPEKQPDRTIAGTLGDIGVTALKGAVGLPQAFVGLADIPTGGRVGRGLEKLGYKPGETQEILSDWYSPAQKYAEEQVQQAEGFIPTLKAAVQNPSTIARAVGESAPLMLGGAAVARSILSKAPVMLARIAPSFGMSAEVLAGAIGEGTIGAGAMAESIREQTENGLLTPEQSAAAIGAGIGTALFSAAGGRLAQKLGIDDIDTLLAGGRFKKPDQVAKAIVAGGVSEGLFEEMPQEMQETVWQNAATGRPLLEGAAEAGAQALLAGAAMGSGANVIAGNAGQDRGADDQGDTTIADTQPTSQPPPVTDTETASEMFETVINGLNTGQLNPDDPAQAEVINSFREQMRAATENPSPEVQEVVAQNRDVLERIGVREPQTDFQETGEPQFTEDVALARAQAIQPKDRTPEEAKLVKDYQERADAEELALRRARAIDDQYRTPEEREIVRAAEQREQEGYAKKELKAGQAAQATEEETAEARRVEATALKRAQAIPENLRTEEEKGLVRAEEKRVETEKAVRGREISKKAEAASREHPAHLAMTEAIKQGGINLDLAKKEGWDLDTLKDVRRPGLFSKKATMGPDEMAQTLGYESEAAMKNEWVKAPTKKELKGIAEAEYTGQDQAIEESVSSLEKEGFELGTEDSVNVGDLNPGDEVVVIDKRGVPDKLIHKGYDEDGDALLQDGVLIKADPFEEIKVIAKKTGDFETSEVVQKKFNQILEETDPKKVKAFAESFPDEIKENPKLKPFQELIEASVKRRLEAIEKPAPDDTGRGVTPPQQPPVDTPEGPAGAYPNKRAVETALRRGENVPQEVMDQYPELSPAAPENISGKEGVTERLGSIVREEGKGKAGVRRELGGYRFNPKKFHEQRRNPENLLLLTDNPEYRKILPENTEKIISEAAKIKQQVKDAEASLEDNKAHLVRFFDKEGVKEFRIKHNGLEYKLTKPVGGETEVLTPEGKDVKEEIYKDYQESGKLKYIAEKGVGLAIQPKKTPVSKVAPYATKTFEQAAREHIDFVAELAEANEKEAIIKARILDQIAAKLPSNGMDHVFRNKEGDTAFNIRRNRRSDYFIHPENGAEFDRIKALRDDAFYSGNKKDLDKYEKQLKELIDPDIKKEVEKKVEALKEAPGTGTKKAKPLSAAGVQPQAARGFKGKGARKKAEEAKIAAEAELDQILKSISGTPLPKGQRADIIGELTEQYGRGVLAQQKRGVFEVVSPERAAEAIRGDRNNIELKRSADNQRLEGLTFPDGRVWLIEGNIEKGTVPGVFAHELGVHTRKLGFKDEKSFQAILNRVEALSKTDEQVKAARERVPDDTPAQNVNEETLAYLVSDAPQHGLVKRLISAVKRFLAQRGWFRMTLDKLTPADLQALAQSAVRADIPAVTRATAGVMKSYAGERAETANVKTLAEAKAMLKAGKDNEVIRQATGWFRAKDGLWRFEIDDNDFKYKGAWLKASELDGFTVGNIFSRITTRDLTVGNIISAPSLFAAYPSLRDVKVGSIDRGRGAFSAKQFKIFLNKEIKLDQALETILHELQHAIQTIEGFSSGASPISFAKEKKELKDELIQIKETYRETEDREEKRRLKEIFETSRLQFDLLNAISRTEFDQYRRVAGEIEARDAVARRKMTSEERKRREPYSSQGISSKDILLKIERANSLGRSSETVYRDGFFFSMSAPAQEARRNTENLNATKDGQTSTTSAEAGEKAIQSIMKTLRKITRKTEEELGKAKAKERKLLGQYRQVINNQAMPINESVNLLNGLVRQADIPDGSKKRIGQLVKQITAAKRPETQRKRLNIALEALKTDISNRFKSQIRAQVKRAAGPKREGVIKRGRYWHEQEKDITSIREIVHNMSSEQAVQAIARVENRLDGLHERLKSAAPENTETLRKQIIDAELRLHHLSTFGGIKDKSLEELLDAKYQIEELRKLGRSKLRSVKEAWQQEIDRKTNWLGQEITGQDDPRPETVAQKNRRKQKEKSLIGRAKGAYQAVENSIQSWEHLLDRIAGKSFYIDNNGKKKTRRIFQSRAVKELGSMAHSATRDAEKYNREVIERTKAKGLDIFGAKRSRTLVKHLQKLSRKTGKIKVAGDTLQLSPMEAAYFYNVRKEPGSEKLFKKMGFTSETWSGIDSLMTKELKAWADYLHDDLLAGVLQGETEAYRTVNGVDRVPVGLFRDDQTDIPVMNLNSAVMNRIFDANHYRAWAVPSKTFNDLFSVPETRGYIEQYAGTSTLKALDKFLEDFAKTPRELRGDMAWMDKLRSNVVMSMLGANPTIFFKQLTSIPAYAADIPTAAFVKNFAHGLGNFGAVRRMIKDSQMAQERFGSGYDRDIHEASKATAEQVIGGKVTRMRDILMAMTKLGDGAAVYAGYTVYKYHYDKHRQSKGHKEAHLIGIEEFERATERTQQAAGVKDRGSFERGSSLQKLLTVYITAPAAYTRNTMAALRHFKTDPVGSSKRLLLFNVMLPMTFQAVASGFVGASGDDDEQWEEFWMKELRAVALGPFLGLPIARDIAAGLWDSAMGEWYGSDVQHSPVTETTKSLTQAVFHASKGLREFDDEAIEKAKSELLDFLGYAAGLPIKPTRRLKEGWDDFLSGDTEHPGLALAGYSRAARDERYLGD